MAIEPMHGAHFAKSYVGAYLTANLPGRLVSYRNAWGVDDVTLPSPVKYLTYEPIALDEWPTIIIFYSPPSRNQLTNELINY